MYHVEVTQPQIVPHVVPKKVSVMETVSGKMIIVSINKKLILLVNTFCSFMNNEFILGLSCDLVFILEVRNQKTYS